jgi:hypothetical protein
VRSQLTIPNRFRGPARSGNGGWTAGSLAVHLLEEPPAPGAGPASTRRAVEVTLRRPPPLETPLTVRHEQDPSGHEGRRAVLLEGEALVAEAREVTRELSPVDPVAADEAAEAMGRYAGLVEHPFPGCFACGPDRKIGDGLQIYPGPVGPGLVASLWVPHASLAVAGDVVDHGLERVDAGTAWAALDCVGGWSEDLVGRPMVLGRITARVDALPAVGEPHVVVGRRTGSEGRKTFTASTLYDSDGRVVATAEHVWVAVDPGAFG